MGCYTVPTIAAIVHYLMRKRGLDGEHHRWLNLLFAGGAIFGIVDHAWNGELLAFSVSDVMLGVVITFTILAAWSVVVVTDKIKLKQEIKASQ